MDECVVAIDDGGEGVFCLCKGCRFLVAPTLDVISWCAYQLVPIREGKENTAAGDTLS